MKNKEIELKGSHMILRIWPVTRDEYDGMVTCMHEIMAAHNKLFHATWYRGGK